MRRKVRTLAHPAALTALLLLGAATGAGCDGCGAGPASDESAGAPAAAEGAATAEDPATPEPAPGEAPESAPEPADEAAEEPGTLRVTGSHDGVVYVNGERWADWVPAPPREVQPGRYGIQVLYAGVELGRPNWALVRAGVHTAMYVRYHGDLPDDLVPRANSNAESVAPPSDAGAGAEPTAVAEGSGEPEAAEGSADAPTEPAAAEGSGEGAAAEGSVEGSGEAVEAATEGVGAPTLRTTRVIVRADQEGVLFVDGRRTETRIPADIEVPVGLRTFQVLYDDDSLSRYIEITLDAGVATEFVYRGTGEFRMQTLRDPEEGSGEGSEEGSEEGG